MDKNKYKLLKFLKNNCHTLDEILKYFSKTEKDITCRLINDCLSQKLVENNRVLYGFNGVEYNQYISIENLDTTFKISPYGKDVLSEMRYAKNDNMTVKVQSWIAIIIAFGALIVSIIALKK